ncbi:MAG: hypothetical protein HXY20_13705 [Acidobacteria bacterium]|nr:hypothetical protein [Acidobacteriota bacterium]
MNAQQEESRLDRGESGSAGTPPYEVPEAIPRPASPRRGTAHAEGRTKSPVLAALMSLMPGLGQCYVGYYQQGFIYILVVASVITVLNQNINALEPLFKLFLAFFWLFNIVDAARRAMFYNEALAGLRPMELPEQIQFPSRHGTLAGGIVLILLGGLLFAHTRFGMPLEWVERWWPVAFILAGLYLIYRSVIEVRKGQKR